MNGMLKDKRASEERKMSNKINPETENSLSTPTTPTATLAVVQMNVSVVHSHPLKTDAKSIQIFLRGYNQHCNKHLSCARLLGNSSSPTEHKWPVDLKFYVDADWVHDSSRIYWRRVFVRWTLRKEWWKISQRAGARVEERSDAWDAWKGR